MKDILLLSVRFSQYSANLGLPAMWSWSQHLDYEAVSRPGPECHLHLIKHLGLVTKRLGLRCGHLGLVHKSFFVYILT